MTDQQKDALLLFGKGFALALQALCALAGAVFLLLIPVVILGSQGMLPGLIDPNDSASPVVASPLTSATIGVVAAAGLAVLFFFFGKMRAIIASVSQGDPFIPDNAQRLEAMAWLFLGFQALAIAIAALRSHAAKAMDPVAYGDEAYVQFSVYDLDKLLMFVILLILARVFRHGAAMREDLEGTV